MARQKTRIREKLDLFQVSLFSFFRTFVKENLLCYNVGAKEVKYMKSPKYYIAVDFDERKLILDSLNNLRNRLIAENRYTDAVDELIIKVSKAKVKKFKII